MERSYLFTINPPCTISYKSLLILIIWLRFLGEIRLLILWCKKRVPLEMWLVSQSFFKLVLSVIHDFSPLNCWPHTCSIPLLCNRGICDPWDTDSSQRSPVRRWNYLPACWLPESPTGNRAWSPHILRSVPWYTLDPSLRPARHTLPEYCWDVASNNTIPRLLRLNTTAYSGCSSENRASHHITAARVHTVYPMHIPIG